MDLEQVKYEKKSLQGGTIYSNKINSVFENIFILILLSLSIWQCSNEDHQKRFIEKYKSESGFGQFAPKDAWVQDSSYAYYGSENEWNRRMFDKHARETFYKREGEAQMLDILDGKLDSAETKCTNYLNEHPGDLESLFNLTVVYSRRQNIDRAFKTMQKAVDAGLPFARFLAGPRDFLKPLTNSHRFKQYYRTHKIELIHGPLLGDVTPHSAKFWVRMLDEQKPVKVKLFSPDENEFVTQSDPVKANPIKDYTAIAKVEGLQANKLYSYNIYVSGNPIFQKNDYPEFRTFPQKKSRNHIRIGYGGCTGYTPQHERIWDSTAVRKFNAFLLLGDNPYIDDPGMPNEYHKYTFYRLQSRPEFKRLIRSTPTYATWDDHDIMDDVWMGPYVDKPDWKLPYLKFYKQNWNNPTHSSKRPGMWYNFSIGDVEIFMLDDRFYRTNPYRDHKTMLGPAQKGWLEKGLKESKATFKIIASGTPWSFKAKPRSKDTWGGFKKEREELFSYIEKNEIDGVILLAGDRHRAEAWKIKRKNGYDFYSLENSKLTNIHTHPTYKNAIFSYNHENTFGVLDIDTNREDPTLTYNVINIDGIKVDSLTIKHSELEH